LTLQDRKTDFERALRDASATRLQLRLFVAGMTPRSTQAIADLERLAAELLGKECSVEVVDIYDDPAAAVEAQVIAIPTLVRDHPPPRHRIVGSIGDIDKVAKSLGISKQETPLS
jgi:circadian clock protein KaiB